MWFRRKSKPDHAERAERNDPAATVRTLREKALRVRADELGLAAAAKRPHVWGVLMETGYAEAVATLVTFADGTVSLYFSNGGGVIGAGEHANVQVAADAFLSAAEAHLSSFAPTEKTELPEVGRVRFYVRTFTGTLSAEADEQDLGHRRHPLAPVFHAGHAVITAVRENAEQR